MWNVDLGEGIYLYLTAAQYPNGCTNTKKRAIRPFLHPEGNFHFQLAGSFSLDVVSSSFLQPAGNPFFYPEGCISLQSGQVDNFPLVAKEM